MGGSSTPYESVDLYEEMPDLEAPLSDSAVGDVDPLLSDVRQRDPFRRKRWRCIVRPDTATETLGPWARLELQILSARDLAEGDNFMSASMRPSVKVFLDDIFAFQTDTSLGADAKWDHGGYLNIVAPRSMARLQVVDAAKGGVGVGFVEFCLGDIPFNTDVEGWMELRFQQNLQRTSMVRYPLHCRERQDSITQEEEGPSLPEVLQSQSPATPKDGLVFREGTYMKARSARIKDPFKAFQCKACRGPGRKASRSPSHDERFNAGELLVRMRLRRVGNVLDSLCALALYPPTPHNFGTFEQLDSLPALDAQMLCDDTMQFKMAVLDDCLICVWNYINYIMRWRCPLVSALLTAVFALTCVRTWLTPATVPLCISVGLFLNKFKRVRIATTTAGSNAPLTQEGFMRVARLEDLGQMRTFLERLVTELGGTPAGTAGSEKMGLLTVRCVRDGVPLLSFAQLRVNLGRAAWISFAAVAFKAGDLVYVDDRFCATVRDVHGDRVTVDFDSMGASTVRQLLEDAPAGTDEVEINRVRMRPVMRKVPGYLIPRVVENYMRMYKHQLENFCSAWYPKVKAIESVLTWKSPCLAWCIVLSCSSTSVGGFVLWFAGDRVDPEATPAAHALKSALALSDNAVVLFLGLAVLVSKARWFVAIRSIARILGQLVCGKRRSAPRCWAFFRHPDMEE